MDTSEIFQKMEQDMNKSIDHVNHEFSSLHTGKANSSMVENISVDVYGSAMKLRDVAAITTPDARTIQIQPWDKSTCGPIEKALIDAKIGITPLITGEIIRLPIPELSGERREELCKMAQGFAENGRIGIRASRKEAMDALKDAQKNGLPEDDLKRAEKEVQKKTDDAVSKINDSLAGKEGDLRQV
ncbi:MAG: ribosome recycling factor [Opitutae bacterium]|nr:ribosome recycling factor [Opitutae bacterium]|tara:strand:- start:1131 stop:1688 length:558 start_codon:yes stop_codon:yes gene_type:complete